MILLLLYNQIRGIAKLKLMNTQRPRTTARRTGTPHTTNRIPEISNMINQETTRLLSLRDRIGALLDLHYDDMKENTYKVLYETLKNETIDILPSDNVCVNVSLMIPVVETSEMASFRMIRLPLIVSYVKYVQAKIELDTQEKNYFRLHHLINKDHFEKQCQLTEISPLVNMQNYDEWCILRINS